VIEKYEIFSYALNTSFFTKNETGNFKVKTKTFEIFVTLDSKPKTHLRSLNNFEAIHSGDCTHY